MNPIPLRQLICDEEEEVFGILKLDTVPEFIRKRSIHFTEITSLRNTPIQRMRYANQA